MTETCLQGEQERLTGGLVVTNRAQTASLVVIPGSLKLPGNMITRQWRV